MGNKEKILEVVGILHKAISLTRDEEQIDLLHSAIDVCESADSAMCHVKHDSTEHEYHLKVYRELIEGAIKTREDSRSGDSHQLSQHDALDLHIAAYKAACCKFNEGDG